MNVSGEDSDELLARAASGHHDATQELFLRHRDRLRRMVAVRIDQRLAARFDPSDVVQDALMDASRKLSRYLQDRPLPFYPWLRQLTLERLIREEEQRRIQDALARLPPHDRDILVLRYLEQLSTSEVAAALGVSESAAKMRYLRALEHIRALLDTSS